MALNGIDISSFQGDIVLGVVPCDFVIIKITQGTTYKNPAYEKQYAGAKANGKLLGEYHYAGGGDPIAEADYFLRWFHAGESIPCLDWESYQNAAFGTSGQVEWCKKWLNRVYEKTGVKPLLYISASLIPTFAGIGDYGLWIAQYATSAPTYGYEEHPWNEGAYSYAIRQYSGTGRLDGFAGNLDLNKFYGDRAAWLKYCTPSEKNAPSEAEKTQFSAKTDNSTAKASVVDLLYGVMTGKYGSGLERKAALGLRYDEIQQTINHIAVAPSNILASEVMKGYYGSGDVRKAILSTRYAEVQKVINDLAQMKTVEQIAREVIAGKWGSGVDRVNRLSAAGYNAVAVQHKVNELLS